MCQCGNGVIGNKYDNMMIEFHCKTFVLKLDCVHEQILSQIVGTVTFL